MAANMQKIKQCQFSYLLQDRLQEGYSDWYLNLKKLLLDNKYFRWLEDERGYRKSC